jgi:ABC-type multidrug transport system ATPase subunit
MKMITYIRKVALEEVGVTKEANVKLKRYSGGMRMCKRLLRKKSVLGVCS